MCSPWWELTTRKHAPIGRIKAHKLIPIWSLFFCRGPIGPTSAYDKELERWCDLLVSFMDTGPRVLCKDAIFFLNAALLAVQEAYMEPGEIDPHAEASRISKNLSAHSSAPECCDLTACLVHRRRLQLRRSVSIKPRDSATYGTKLRSSKLSSKRNNLRNEFRASGTR